MMESQSHSEVTGEKMLPPPPGTFQDREDLIRHVRDFGANQGYVVTIKKSRKDRRVILGCDRGGVYRNRRKIEENKRKRKAHSRLINCPFEAIGKKEDDVWVLIIKNSEHNHEPLKDMSEHPYSRRFSEEEVRQIKQMIDEGIKPRQVLKSLKQSNPELQSTPRHLYNLKAKIRLGNLTEKSLKSWRPNRSVLVSTSTEASTKQDCPLKVPNLIEGKFVDSQACAIIDVINPATQEVVSQVPLTTYEEFKAAVSAAKQAFSLWKNTPVTTRQRIMFKFQELIRRDIDKLAMNISTEQGKTLNGAKSDVLCGLEVVEHACGMASLQMGEFVPNASNGIDTYCIREPLGVCAGICPFNFPAMISVWMFPIAVTCGNTFILKPSEKNPGASMILAALAVEAGLPDGVLNIVHGTNEIVNYICDDDDIKAVSFVGPSTVAMHSLARAAATGKRVQSNMGAKNHAIIMPDASADATLDALVAAGFGAAGQRCMALSTAVFVGGSMPWEEELVDRAKALKVNVGTEPGADLGPVITKEAKDRICRLVESGVKSGARLILDGRDIVVPQYEHGNFVGPTILCDVTTSMECYKEEIFGPVLLCMQSDSLEDAITIVNRNKYGNGASIFTTSGIAARNFQNEIEAGLVGINVPVPIPLPFSCFNGSETSCAGDLNFCGKAGVQFYTQIKTVAQKWKDLPSRRVSLHPPSTSETEITSRRVSLLQPPNSESDLPYREMSPAMPSAWERDLPSHKGSLSLTPTSERDLPNPVVSLTSPATSERASTNQEIPLHLPLATERQLPGPEVSVSMPRTSERVYMPTSNINDIMVSVSHRNDSAGPISRTDPNMYPTVERVYMPTISHRNENVGPSVRTDTTIHRKSERVYMPTSHRSDSMGLMSLRNDTMMHPTSERMFMNTSMISSQRSDAIMPLSSEKVYMPASAIQTNDDGMPSTSDSLFVPAKHQRIYSSHQLLSVDEYPDQGVSLTMPTSQRI